MEKDKIFIDFTRGHFGEHEFTEKLKALHVTYQARLKKATGCMACHARRVNAEYKNVVFHLLASND